ncbi:MAG: hypothetical protein AAGP08_07765, partial [Pseudomonadota bacterium]
AHPSPEVRAHRIYGATPSSTTLTLLDEVDGTSYTRRPVSGDLITRYKVTAVTYADRESDPAQSPFIEVVPTGVPLADLNSDVTEMLDGVVEAAENARDIAATNADIIADVISQDLGVLDDQFLPYGGAGDFVNFGAGPTVTLNEIYGIGNTWAWNIDATTDASVYILDSSPRWVGAKGLERYTVTIEFQLLSGSLSGATLRFTWVSSGGTFNAWYNLADLIDGALEFGRVYSVSFVAKRPSNFSGATAQNNIALWTNTSQNGQVKAAKHIKFHRLYVTPTSGDVAVAENAALSAQVTAANVAQFRQDAEQAATTAVTAQTATARYASGGASANPFFATWTLATPGHMTVFMGSGSITKDIVNARYQNSALIAATNTETEGPKIGILTGQNGHETIRSSDVSGIEVTLEVELVSGVWDGTRIFAIFRGTIDAEVNVYLDTLVSGDATGIIHTLRFIIDKPDAWTHDPSDDYVHVYLNTKDANEAPKQIRLHSFDISAIYANSSAQMLQFAHATSQGIAQSGIMLRTVAGSGGAELELVSASDLDGAASLARIRADQIQLIGQILAAYLNIDGPLIIDAASGSFVFGKQTASDPAPGVFMGNTGGQPAFVYSINIGGREYSARMDNDGLTFTNPGIRVGTGAYPSFTDVTASGSVTLPASSLRLRLNILGGGQGGSGVTNGTDVVAADGGDTVVEIFDGPTLVRTWTANGGTGAYPGGGNGQSSEMGTGGQKGFSSDGQDAPSASYGAGGGGGSLEVSAKQGGAAGQFVTEIDYDLSGFANAPRLEFTIGLGSDGGGTPRSGASPNTKGGRGANGLVRYSASADAPSEALIVSKTPQVGSFTTSTAAENFPVEISGAGQLLLRANSGDLNLGVVEISDNPAENWPVTGTSQISLNIQKRPRKQAGGVPQTIHYQFFPA